MIFLPLLLFLFQDLATLSSQGAAAMREKRYADAVRIYSEVTSRDRTNPMWRMNLGIALASSGRHQEAVTELAAFLRVRPEPGPAHFFSGLSLLKLGRPCEAIKPLESARKWSSASNVLIELGDAYHGCKRWAQAAAVYEQAARAKPTDTRLPRQIARCWWLASRYEKARPLYASLEPTHGHEAEFLFEYGDTLARLEGAEAGLPLLRKAVAAEPGYLPARAALGRALMESGQPAEALPHLEAAASQDPALLLPLSRAYRALGRNAEASRTEAEYKAKIGAVR